MHHVMSAIRTRKSSRKFKNEKISDGSVYDIIKAGTLAPSTKNCQPWEFLIIKSSKIRNQISDIMINFVADKSKDLTGDLPEYLEAIVVTQEAIRQAPMLVMIYTTEMSSKNISNILSIGACIENMLLRATECNIGSLWIRDYIYMEDKISEILEIPGEYNKLISIIALGISNDNSPRKLKKTMSAVLKDIDYVTKLNLDEED